MKYNIVTIADIHRGAIDPEIHNDHLEFIFAFLDEFTKDDVIDMIVIIGDYWDSNMSMNSSPAISGVSWLHMLKDKAIDIGVKIFRIVKGTKEHDNDQLEVFRPLEDIDGFFKIFNTTTTEESLQDLQCIYCPDETMNNEDYKETYINEMLSGNRIGFFHGSFDVVLPEILLQTTAQSQKNVVYEYALWESLIDGPLLAGHWHDGKTYEHLSYNGSTDRWRFNEDEPKGFGFTQYDTETSEYFYQKIENILSPVYLTYECYTNLCETMEAYQPLIKAIDTQLNKYSDGYRKLKIRIIVYIVNDNPNNDTYITSLRHYYMNEKRVILKIKNKLKDKKKKDEVAQNKDDDIMYGFVSDKNKSYAEILQEFILKKKGVAIPLDFIEAKINKYI